MLVTEETRSPLCKVPAELLGEMRKRPKGMLIHASLRRRIQQIVAATNTIPGECRGRSESIRTELGNSHFVTENSRVPEFCDNKKLWLQDESKTMISTQKGGFFQGSMVGAPKSEGASKNQQKAMSSASP